MLFNFKKQKKEIFISKSIDDLAGLKDVTVNPRSYSPERLNDACNNICFDAKFDIDPIENLTIQFIFRKFFISCIKQDFIILKKILLPPCKYPKN